MPRRQNKWNATLRFGAAGRQFGARSSIRAVVIDSPPFEERTFALDGSPVGFSYT